MPAPPPPPAYRRIADTMRQRITTGALPPGALLPTETEMMEEFGVSRGTVRQAIALLRAEGLVLTYRRKGSQVRPTPLVRRLGADRYRREAAIRDGDTERATSFTVDQGIGWDDYQLDKTFDRVPAAGEVAEELGVPEGTELLRRQFVFRALGAPQQMSTSYLLWEMVAGTPVADPANEPWPGGTIAQLGSLGVRVDAVTEQVRARMPSSQEAELLRVPAGVPVLAITRTMLAGSRPVETAVEIVIPGDRVVLDYRIEL